ncbi:MAG: LysE family translocator [Methylococcales bacterium]|nr:LysE family translocator [Methylococcales bacterium]
MFGTHDLSVFIFSGLLLNITPGADSLYIITRSTSQGWRAGMAAAFGICAGCYIHIFAAAIGLSALLAASAVAFTLVKLIGALYLVYFGITLIRNSQLSAQPVEPLAPVPLLTIFCQGFLTDILNPKVALFFLAFVPQFIESSSPNKALAFIFLGAIFSFNAMLWCLFLAWTAAHFAHITRRHRSLPWFTRTLGGLFIFLGLKLALSKQS